MAARHTEPTMDFYISHLTPDDRIFIQRAQNSLFSAAFYTALGSIGLIWLPLRYSKSKLPRRTLTLIGFAVSAPIILSIHARSIYQRAIIELPETSYLRKYLFDTAVTFNPNLNAQQLYSQIALSQERATMPVQQIQPTPSQMIPEQWGKPLPSQQPHFYQPDRKKNEV